MCCVRAQDLRRHSRTRAHNTHAAFILDAPTHARTQHTRGVHQGPAVDADERDFFETRWRNEELGIVPKTAAALGPSLSLSNIKDWVCDRLSHTNIKDWVCDRLSHTNIKD